MDTRAPVLIVVGGLPGTGKTTVARQVAERIGATYLRIDTIEQALRSSLGLGDDLGPAGYIIAYEIGETNLTPGQSVVADCVNPLPVTRDAWREIATRSNAAFIEVELSCSDAAEHRRRVEMRDSDIPGLVQPDWSEVVSRDYEPWQTPLLRIDTSRTREDQAVELILQAIERARPAMR